jgi:hypothetical protein
MNQFLAGADFHDLHLKNIEALISLNGNNSSCVLKISEIKLRAATPP